jgi:hypothetical protein
MPGYQAAFFSRELGGHCKHHKRNAGIGGGAVMPLEFE